MNNKKDIYMGLGKNNSGNKSNRQGLRIGITFFLGLNVQTHMVQWSRSEYVFFTLKCSLKLTALTMYTSCSGAMI